MEHNWNGGFCPACNQTYTQEYLSQKAHSNKIINGMIEATGKAGAEIIDRQYKAKVEARKAEMKQLAKDIIALGHSEEVADRAVKARNEITKLMTHQFLYGEAPVVEWDVKLGQAVIRPAKEKS